MPMVNIIISFLTEVVFRGFCIWAPQFLLSAFNGIQTLLNFIPIKVCKTLRFSINGLAFKQEFSVGYGGLQIKSICYKLGKWCLISSRRKRYSYKQFTVITFIHLPALRLKPLSMYHNLSTNAVVIFRKVVHPTGKVKYICFTNVNIYIYAAVLFASKSFIKLLHLFK